MASKPSPLPVALMVLISLQVGISDSLAQRQTVDRGAGQVPTRGQTARRYLPDPVQDSDYYDAGSPSLAKVELGKLLFFDKILSGNKKWYQEV